MSDELRPYTVSGVVNLADGEATEPVHVLDGHHDFDGFTSAEPLTANDQFRWVHVVATDRAAAASTDALTADLRPGGRRDAPVARALDGHAGLKRYTVIGIVQRLTRRLVVPPVALPGHDDTPGVFEGRRSERAHVTLVWAIHEADAINQVFSTGRAPRAKSGTFVGQQTMVASTIPVEQQNGARHRAGSNDPARPDPPPEPEPEPERNAPQAVIDAARDAWPRLEQRVSIDARVALVADTAWQSGYADSYRSAYTTTAAHIADSAATASTRNPHAWLTLHELGVAAGDAITQLNPDGHLIPPADQRTITAARMAAHTAAPEPAVAVAETAWTAGRTAGTVAGTITATSDILVGWRARGGHTLAGALPINGQPGRAWVADLLATANRDTTAPLASHQAAPGVGGLTAAQLARQDQAPDATTVTTAQAAISGRHRAQPAGPRHSRSR